MFENSRIVFEQIIIMFLIMMLGVYIYRKGVMDNNTTRKLSVFLSRYVMPCITIRAFQREYDRALAKTLGVLLVLAVLSFVVSIVLARAVFRKDKTANYTDRRTCVILTNDGFMAVPLIAAMFGETGVFLAAAHICTMAVVLWTYSVYELSRGKEKLTFKSVVLYNPGVVAAVLGLLIFVSPVKLPRLAFTAVSFVADINTPLAMICLGCFIAQVRIRECITDLSLWLISGLRLLVIPLLMMLGLLFLPIDGEAKLTLLVGVAAPSAIACAMFSQIYGEDFLYSTRAVALTTILSVVTLPAVIAVMESLMHLTA